MKADSKYNRILVDLDSILDIRQAVLGRLLDEEKLATYVASEEYNFRSVDDFSSVVNMGQYEAFNKQRDKLLISMSTITSLFTIIRDKIVNIEEKNTKLNELRKTELYINIYPFQLTESEQEELIDVVFTKMETNVFIKAVYIEYKDLTPSFLINTEISDLYLYNATSWLNLQLENVKNYKAKIHSVKINFPAIYATKLTEEMQAKITKTGFSDIFSFMEYIVSEHAVINFLPVLFYNNLLISKAYMERFNRRNMSTAVTEMYPNAEEEAKVVEEAIKEAKETTKGE